MFTNINDCFNSDFIFNINCYKPDSFNFNRQNYQGKNNNIKNKVFRLINICKYKIENWEDRL